MSIESVAACISDCMKAISDNNTTTNNNDKGESMEQFCRITASPLRIFLTYPAAV